MAIFIPSPPPVMQRNSYYDQYRLHANAPHRLIYSSKPYLIVWRWQINLFYMRYSCGQTVSKFIGFIFLQDPCTVLWDPVSRCTKGPCFLWYMTASRGARPRTNAPCSLFRKQFIISAVSKIAVFNKEQILELKKKITNILFKRARPPSFRLLNSTNV